MACPQGDSSYFIYSFYSIHFSQISLDLTSYLGLRYLAILGKTR